MSAFYSMWRGEKEREIEKRAETNASVIPRRPEPKDDAESYLDNPNLEFLTDRTMRLSEQGKALFAGYAASKVTFGNEMRGYFPFDPIPSEMIVCATDFGVSFDAPYHLMAGDSNSGVMEPLRADPRESVNTAPSSGCEIDRSHEPVIHSGEGSIPSPKIKTVEILHSEAMALCDEADVANRARDFDKAADLYEASWKKESDAWLLATGLGADRVTCDVLKKSKDALYQNSCDAHERFMNCGIKVMPAVQPMENDDA
jgi:hypothetical protein